MYDLLSGVKVVEVAAWTFVPSAGAVCADWGADVVKVEHPETGDPQRGLFVSDLGQGAPDVMIEQPNRGKRSLTLDLRSEQGHQVLSHLVQEADVFLTNMLPAARRKLRIDVGDLRAVNPRLIYAKGSGYGARGPEADTGGFDIASAWARAGVGMELTAQQARPADDGEPVWQPPAFFDLIGGLTIAGGIAAALFDRERTGRARVVDVSLLATGVWAVAPAVLASGHGGSVLARAPRTGRHNPVVNTFMTKDGRWLMLVLLQANLHWRALCTKLGRPEMADDPRFVDQASRAAHRSECVAALDALFARRTLREWQEELRDFEGVWSPFQNAREVFDDPQVAAAGILPVVERGDRHFNVVASPAQFDETPPGRLRPAPTMGEHSEEVLLELGRSWDEIIELKVAGVVL